MICFYQVGSADLLSGHAFQSVKRAHDSEPLEDERSAKRTRLDAHADAEEPEQTAARAKRAAQQPRVEDVEDEEEAPRHDRLPGEFFSGIDSDDGVQQPPAAEGIRTGRAERAERRAHAADVPGQQDAEDSERPREKLTRPSPDLRSKCPLCFGGVRPNLQHTE